jgi:hypothetical protein
MRTNLVDFLLCLHYQGTLHCVVEKKDTTLSWPKVLEGHLLCQ